MGIFYPQPRGPRNTEPSNNMMDNNKYNFISTEENWMVNNDPNQNIGNGIVLVMVMSCLAEKRQYCSGGDGVLPR